MDQSTLKNGHILAESPQGPVWKPDLYKLQEEAPRPHAVLCLPRDISDSERPLQYGPEFHGAISHAQAACLLSSDGDYLVRTSASGAITLSLLFRGKVKHYRLYYSRGEHYVREKCRFSRLNELVADGLVTLHIEAEAGSYVALMSESARYEKSPAYLTLTRLRRGGSRPAGGHGGAPPPTVAPAPPVSYDKPHNFRGHNFKGLNWCEFCTNFLWGFTAQGVKCEDCGFVAHWKCSEKLPADCWPELKEARGVFGVDLTTVVRAHRSTRPFVVDKCVEEIEARGLSTEGLYRLSPFQDEMDALRTAFDKEGKNADLSANVYDNINVVAGILKLYFRLLPIPLITFTVHPLLVAAVQLQAPPQEQLRACREALALLPPAHYNTLKFLMGHLHRVVEREGENKMSAQNLGTVFAPTLMPMPLSRHGGIPDMTGEITALCLLINHHDILLP